MTDRLRLYSDRKYLTPGKKHIVMLYPFWGPNEENPHDPTKGRFDRYASGGGKFFEMSSLDKSDIVVAPGEWEGKGKSQNIVELGSVAHQYNKPIAIFFNSDSDERIDVFNAYVFRTSLYASTRRKREFAVPGWSEDLLEKYSSGKIVLREKKPRPVVGYCGYSKLSVQRLKRLIVFAEFVISGHGMSRSYDYAGLRRRALNRLEADPYVETNFIVRKRFWGGAVVKGRYRAELARVVRREFVENILNSDYILCSRGAGNFSYRLYETLSCGRIPVFIDTDCVLPYDHLIDWRKYCVWVDEHGVDHIASSVRRFHDSLSPGQFEELQCKCRQLWEEWISPEGFFANFHRHLMGLNNPETLRSDSIHR